MGEDPTERWLARTLDNASPTGPGQNLHVHGVVNAGKKANLAKQVSVLDSKPGSTESPSTRVDVR